MGSRSFGETCSREARLERDVRLVELERTDLGGGSSAQDGDWVSSDHAAMLRLSRLASAALAGFDSQQRNLKHSTFASAASKSRIPALSIQSAEVVCMQQSVRSQQSRPYELCS